MGYIPFYSSIPTDLVCLWKFNSLWNHALLFHFLVLQFILSFLKLKLFPKPSFSLHLQNTFQLQCSWPAHCFWPSLFPKTKASQVCSFMNFWFWICDYFPHFLCTSRTCISSLIVAHIFLYLPINKITLFQCPNLVVWVKKLKGLKKKPS